MQAKSHSCSALIFAIYSSGNHRNWICIIYIIKSLLAKLAEYFS